MFGLTFSVKLNVPAFQAIVNKQLGCSANLTALVAEATAAIKTIKLPSSWLDFNGFLSGALALKNVVAKIVALVEASALTVAPMSSEAKKELAVTLLDALVEFPGPLEAVDGMVFGLLISFVVDECNKLFGKSWTPTQLLSLVK
jgi:hypothetical protein